MSGKGAAEQTEPGTAPTAPTENPRAPDGPAAGQFFQEVVWKFRVCVIYQMSLFFFAVVLAHSKYTLEG